MLVLQLSPDTPARLTGVGSASTDQALPPGRWTPLTWSAPPTAGLTLTLRPAGPGALDLRYEAFLDGWPPGIAPPSEPPPEVMTTGLSGEARITGTRRATW
jgi:hypothetical protein